MQLIQSFTKVNPSDNRIAHVIDNVIMLHSRAPRMVPFPDLGSRSFEFGVLFVVLLLRAIKQ